MCSEYVKNKHCITKGKGVHLQNKLGNKVLLAHETANI